MRKLIFILLLFAGCKETPPVDPYIEYCCDCTEIYSGWYAFPAFCGTSDEVNLYMEQLYSTQKLGLIDYYCTKYINDK